MPASTTETSLAHVRAALHAAQLAVVRAGAVTWRGTAADAAESRRVALLAALRACLQDLDDVERLAVAARRAEQVCVAGRPSLGVDGGPRWG